MQASKQEQTKTSRIEFIRKKLLKGTLIRKSADNSEVESVRLWKKSYLLQFLIFATNQISKILLLVSRNVLIVERGRFRP